MDKQSIKQLILSVHSDFVIPDVYKNGSIDEIEEAIFIGATIQNTIHVRRGLDEARIIEERHSSELEEIKRMYAEKMEKLESEKEGIITVLTKEHTVKVKEIALLSTSKERERCMQENAERMQILQSRLEGVEERRRVMEEGRERDIRDAVLKTEAMMEKIVAAKQDQLNKMEASYSKLNDTILKQSQEIVKLSSTLGKRAANVKMKGNDYEEGFGEKLRLHYGLCKGFALFDTRLGMGHEMDFCMNMEGEVVLWEVKNYGNVVPKAEVEKFLRDLKENPQAKIGIMLSRATDIYGKAHTGISGSMVTEFDGDKMMIYINRFEEFCGEDEHRVFQTLLSLCRIWWQYHREDGYSFDRVEVIRELEKAIEDISKRRTDWRRHKAHLEEMSRWATDLLDESEHRLDRMLKRARHVEEKKEEKERATPNDVFREVYEERDKGWVASIMKVCEAGGEIEVRELVELLTGLHKLSRDTIRTNVMSVILDSAVVKKGVIKYVKGISKYKGDASLPLTPDQIDNVPCAIRFKK